MDNPNKNQIVGAFPPMPTPPGKQPKKSSLILGIVALVAFCTLTYAGVKNGSFLGAAITQSGAPAAGADQVYIPNYTAAPADTGTISVKTRNDILTFDSLTFTLNYDPVDGIQFNESPLVFDADTQIKSSNVAFQIASQPEPGKLVVTIIMNTPIAVNVTDPNDSLDHLTLFKLNTQISESIAVGQVIDFNVNDLVLLNGVAALNMQPMVTGDITIAGGVDELRALNAEAIDATHLVVRFSDYLSSIGNAASYDIYEDGDGDLPLVVSAVESGTLYGYDQKSVVLTTATQDPGQRYSVTVGAPVSGNSQGGMDVTAERYDNVLFHGYGTLSGSISDFGMVSAVAPDYNTFTVTFSHDVDASSVTKTDFTLTQLPATAITISNVTAVSGKTVTLTVNTATGALLNSGTYLLAATANNAVLRASDGKPLGIDRVTFSGTKSGPRIVGATILNTAGVYTAHIAFNENIQYDGTILNNPVGRVYATTLGAGGSLVSEAVPAWNQTVSGNNLLITSPTFNDPNAHFTFSVSTNTWLRNSMGVGVAPGYKSIGFWGYGHNSSTTGIGNATITKKDVISINPGTLDFNAVQATDVTLLYDDGSGSLVETNQDVSAVTVVGGTLQISTDPIPPDRHLIIRIVDNPTDDNTLAVPEVVNDRTLSVTSAQAVSATQVRVNFSAGIDERNVSDLDFSTVPVLAVGAATIEAGYTSVLLTTAAQTPGTVYRVTAGSDVHAFTGGPLLNSTGVFAGYQTVAAESPVTLQTVTAPSSTKIQLTFTGAINSSTVTPVNISVYGITSVDTPAGSPLVAAPLTITGVTQVSPSVFDLTTSVQTAVRNYFVVFNGVKDSSGLLISNKKTLNVLGFTVPVPVVNLVTPSNFTNEEDKEIILSGKNLNVITSARIGTTNVNIVNQPATGTSLTLLIPGAIATGTYSISLTDTSGTVTVVSNAVLVNQAQAVLQVNSAASQAIPFNVPNDGVTKTTLWVLVEDAEDLANVSSVSVDLKQVGGSSTQEMTKDTGPQPQGGQWYKYETAVSTTTATKADPYLLPVKVRKDSEVISGTISIKVTKDVLQSITPVINQIYASPVSVSPDATTPVRISAQITDEDGAQTISSVTADLGLLGLGFFPLSPIGEVTEGQELVTRFYQSETFTIPRTTKTGTYTINVVASDNTGEKTTSALQLTVSTELTGPDIDESISYIAPRKSVPNDGKTTFSLHVYVTDPDGISDVDTVTANFGAMGLPPTALIKGVDVSETAKSAWYSVEGLTIPRTSPLGVNPIEIRAVDKSGGKDNLIIQLDVTHKDTLGDPPRVLSERNYTTPRITANDGATAVTLYAFVRDDDSDIESVVVNLSQIGQVGVETGGDLTETDSSENDTASGGCPTGSNVLVCMNPSVREGESGQWFILPDVTISENTSPSPQPYAVDVIVTDISGKTAQGTIPVYVSDGSTLESNQNPPQMIAAISTSETTVELVFSKEIASTSISPSGAEFKISNHSNINDILIITGATINAAGDVVTLTTAPQVANRDYVLSAGKTIRDVIGLTLVEGLGNKTAFKGFSSLGRPPVIDYIAATDVDKIEIEFQNPLRPSSINTGGNLGGQMNVQIYEEGGAAIPLAVKGIRFTEANVLEVTTDLQKGGQRYRVKVEGIASADGTPSTTLSRMVKGYSLKAVARQAAANQADLNADGMVDFTDFTIFSSVYGTSYINPTEGEGFDSGIALDDIPDSTVPHTSETGNDES